MLKGQPVDPKEWLLRRGYCNPLKNYLNPDGSATSRVFKLRPKDNGKLSVDVKSLTEFYKAIGDEGRFILFELMNETVLGENLQSLHEPLEDGSNDAHALILGIKEEDEIIPRKLAANSRQVKNSWL